MATCPPASSSQPDDIPMRPKDFTLQNTPEHVLRAAQQVVAPHIDAMQNLRQKLRQHIHESGSKDEIQSARRVLKSYRQATVQEFAASRKKAVCQWKAMPSGTGGNSSAAIENVVVTKLALELFRTNCQQHRREWMKNHHQKEMETSGAGKGTLSKDDIVVPGTRQHRSGRRGRGGNGKDAGIRKHLKETTIDNAPANLLERARETIHPHIQRVQELDQVLADIPNGESTARHEAQENRKQARMQARKTLHSQRIAAREALNASIPGCDDNQTLLDNLVHARLCLMLFRQYFGGTGKQHRGEVSTDEDSDEREDSGAVDNCCIGQPAATAMMEQCGTEVTEASDSTQEATTEVQPEGMNAKQITLSNAPERLRMAATAAFAPHAAQLSKKQDAFRMAGTAGDRKAALHAFRSTCKAVRSSFDGVLKEARQAIKKNRTLSGVDDLVVARLTLQLLNAFVDRSKRSDDGAATTQDNEAATTATSAPSSGKAEHESNEQETVNPSVHLNAADTPEPVSSAAVEFLPDAAFQELSTTASTHASSDVIRDFTSLKEATAVSLANAPSDIRECADILFRDTCEELQAAAAKLIEMESPRDSKSSRLALKALKGKYRAVLKALQHQRKSARRAVDQAKKNHDKSKLATNLRDLTIARVALELLQQWEVDHQKVLGMPAKESLQTDQSGDPAPAYTSPPSPTARASSPICLIPAAPGTDDHVAGGETMAAPLANLCTFLAHWDALPSTGEVDPCAPGVEVRARIRAALVTETRLEIAVLQQRIADAKTPAERQKAEQHLEQLVALTRAYLPASDVETLV
eukprot:m.1637364 g.1637364  ORF g.1637364 m.1637364 type:complete len:811 (-) comp25761_c0_seq1:426-2858(-)